MDFLELVTARSSTRSFSPKAVEDTKLQLVLEAARLAPSACNRQPLRLVVVHTRGREQELLRVYDEPWFVQAPIVIAAVGLPDVAWARMDCVSYHMVDVAIALDHLILAAASVGLGTCWVAAFDPAAARDVLRLPPGAEPVAFTPLGYSAVPPAPKVRLPISQLVRYEHW